MKIIKDLVSYNNLLQKRNVKDIRMVVLHITELPTLTYARKAAEVLLPGKKIGVCGHYYINRDGKVNQYVEVNRIAQHVFLKNKDSIGIEIVNRGRFPNWFSSKNQVPTEKFSNSQISALLSLLRYLKKEVPSLSEIKKHSDLDRRMIPAKDNPQIKVYRRIDPGPLFPWGIIVKQWEKINS